MIVFIGDTHGNFLGLQHLLKEIDTLATVIQVGDFGYWPGLRMRWEEAKINRPIYFIDGNHDCLPMLTGGTYFTSNANRTALEKMTAPAIEKITEVWPNAFYIPRGSVMEIDGKRLAFMGGAGSVDKAWRHVGIDWFPEEQITKYDVDRLLSNLMIDGNPMNLKKVDILVSHTPPNNCVQANFNPMDLVNYFGLSKDWRDSSAFEVEALATRLGNPQIICGHMHRCVKWANVRILNIDEVMTME